VACRPRNRRHANLDHGDAYPVFSGGTSLSVGWGLIKRFSEDIDFKVGLPEAASSSQARTQRRNYRDKVLAAFQAADLQLLGEPISRNASQFFRADFAYENAFAPAAGLRPHIRVEMTFQAPKLPSVQRPLQSLVARGQRLAPEIAAFACVDPVETAADKLSALAWRVCTRKRGAEDDDPTIVRHLHDLAALERIAANADTFARLVRGAMANDAGRGGGEAPGEPEDRFARLFELLTGDAQWAKEYEQFIHDKSFARADELISFAAALEAARRLADRTGRGNSVRL
jgi:hypothetical protein